MSLILDALNRSRREAEQVPGLATDHDIQAPPQRGDRRQRLLLAALLAAAAAIAWLLWERSTQPAPAAQTPAVSETPAAQRESPEPAAPPAAAAGPAPGAQPPPQPAPAAEVAAAAPASRVPAAATAADTARDSSQGEAPSAGVAALYRQQREAAEVPASPATASTAVNEPEQAAATSPAPVAREEEPIDIEQLVAAAEAELDNARLAEHPAPFLIDLSQQTKDAIPTLLYQAHDYAGEAGSSLVLINGKELRVGGSTSGVRVEEILPDSVVLSFQGTQFRLRALNSWVNL